MDGYGEDVGISTGELGGEEDVGDFALTVADPGPEKTVLRGAQVLEHDPAFGVAAETQRGEDDDANVRLGLRRGFQQRGEEELGEQSVPEVIGPELDFVSVRGQPGGRGHDAGVADENVEALGGEFRHAGFDRGERGEVALDEGEVGTGHDGRDLADDFARLLGVPAAEIDLLGVVLGQRHDRFCSQASGPCSVTKSAELVLEQRETVCFFFFFWEARREHPPPVMKMTLSARSGMSLSALKLRSFPVMMDDGGGWLVEGFHTD